MKDYVYFVKDKLTGEVLFSVLAPSDGVAIRSIVPSVISKIPLKDLVVYKGKDRIDTIITESTPVTWEAYKYPESRADALKPLNIVDYSGNKPIEVK